MTRTLRHAALVSVLGIGIILTGCTPAPDVSVPPASDPAPAAPSGGAAPTLTDTPATIVSGLAAPWSIVFLDDGTALVSQRDDGTILELLDDGTTRVVGTVDGIRHAGESGLLGLTVDDDNRLYAYSTADDGNRIQRFEVTGAAGSLGLGPAETIIDGLPSASYHDGGRIAFGPDGMLYATAGDAGNRDGAQDLDYLGGKILRMTRDGDVPDDNPFPGSFVYSYGHRNPQGIAWAADGTLFATEFGQDTWDELNIITPGTNYGWPIVEGTSDQQDYVNPVQQWSTDQASPSGIAIVDDTIYIANLRGEVLRAVPVGDPSTSTDYYTGELGRLRDVAQAPDGDLWFLTNNTDGRGSPGEGDDRILAVTPST